MCDKPKWLIWFWKFLFEGLSSFNMKRFYYSHPYFFCWCERGSSFCTRLISRNSTDSYLFFRLALFHSVCYSFFFFYRSFSSTLCTFVGAISSKIDEVLLINPSANMFVLGDFNIYQKDWLTYSGGADISGKLCYNFKRPYTDG